MGVFADGYAKIANMKYECRIKNICFKCKKSLYKQDTFCEKEHPYQTVDDCNKVCKDCAVLLKLNHRNANSKYAFRERKEYRVRFYNHTAQEEQEYYVITYSMLRAIKLWRKDFPRKQGYDYIKISNYVPPKFKTESKYLE